MVYITGDTHRVFDKVFEFCEEYETTRDDILIILGDAGINFNLDYTDEELKQELSELPVTLFCVHGNHEERPELIRGYEEVIWRGGIVYMEPEFPNLLFPRDGEIFDFDGKKAVVIGGAYSVDKYYRLANGGAWFPSEQPDEYVKMYVEANLKKTGWKVDYVLSHTAPLKYEPVEFFIDGIDQSRVDKSTEEWLDSIEERLEYEAWYLGHYHCDKCVGKIRIMYWEIDELA